MRSSSSWMASARLGTSSPSSSVMPRRESGSSARARRSALKRALGLRGCQSGQGQSGRRAPDFGAHIFQYAVFDLSSRHSGWVKQKEAGCHRYVDVCFFGGWFPFWGSQKMATTRIRFEHKSGPKIEKKGNSPMGQQINKINAI